MQMSSRHKMRVKNVKLHAGTNIHRYFCFKETTRNYSKLKCNVEKFLCHRLNCDYSVGGVMGSVLMCIFNVD